MLKQANKFLFCDTELLVTMIWSQFVFGKVSPWITEQLSKQKYNLILLTNIDIPWTFDPLREHPDHREELFYLYKKKLQDLHLPYEIVSGTGNERVENAVDKLRRHHLI
jgi:nicotinamide riboside kinase